MEVQAHVPVSGDCSFLVLLVRSPEDLPNSPAALPSRQSTDRGDGLEALSGQVDEPSNQLRFQAILYRPLVSIVEPSMSGD